MVSFPRYYTHPFCSKTILYSGSTHDGRHSHTRPGLSYPFACKRFSVSAKYDIFIKEISIFTPTSV